MYQAPEACPATAKVIVQFHVFVSPAGPTAFKGQLRSSDGATSAMLSKTSDDPRTEVWGDQADITLRLGPNDRRTVEIWVETQAPARASSARKPFTIKCNYLQG